MGLLQTKFIADNAVTADKIEDAAITTAKIAAQAVDDEKIANNAVLDNHIASSAVTEAKIDNLAVTVNKIGTSAVTTAKIAAQAVDESKFLLSNNGWLNARDFADSADIPMMRLNTSDEIVFNTTPKVGATSVALLSDIPTLPSTFELQGNWNANTNTPTLVSSTNSTGDTNPLYIVNVAGTTSIDGEAFWSAGDHIYFANGVWNKADNVDDVLSVNTQTGAVVLDTDDLLEGVNKFYATSLFDTDFGTKTTTDLTEGTNLYHTDTRAKTAAVLNTTAGSETDQAASVAAMKTYVAGEVSAAIIPAKETFTLIAGDITNQYVDLTQVAKASSFVFAVRGAAGPMEEGVDYTVSLTGGAGGKTRLTFAGILATAGAAALVATDVVIVQYTY